MPSLATATERPSGSREAHPARWLPRSSSADDGSGPLADRVLASRADLLTSTPGLPFGDAARRFLDPSMRDLHDPGLLPGVDAAATRLLEAADRAEPIVIYGDYDADGVTSTAILYRTLSALRPDADVRWYVPHRIDEGYGLNAAALERLAGEGARVVVTVDCGITAAPEAALARRLGVDLIITDHHNAAADAPLPDAFAIVHPTAAGGAYPFGELCGAGVAFKLAWRLVTTHCNGDRATPELRALLLELLPLAAIGTVADVVPLVDENRVITRFGLPACSRSSFPGLRAILDRSTRPGARVDAQTVGFGIGPRLNAAGRLGHARDAVELLLTDDEERAEEIAASLCSLNEKRKRTERHIAEQASELAERSGMTTPDSRVIVLANEGWHAGVIGIACSRLVERYHRPVVLMERRVEAGREICAGSGRSIDGFNLHAALSSCADHLETFGGHDMAAGLSLAASSLDAFREAMQQHAAQKLATDDLRPTHRYDARAHVGELELAALRALAGLAPFGRGNPEPCLRIDRARVADLRVMGSGGKHVAITLEQQAGRGRAAVRAVGWNWVERLRDRGLAALGRGDSVDLLGRPGINEFNGSSSPQIELVDLRPA
ncbi:MAG: single-stranded-DNA-specific exonuclease RecJ [Planctomycetota bacterium]